MKRDNLCGRREEKIRVPIFVPWYNQMGTLSMCTGEYLEHKEKGHTPFFFAPNSKDRNIKRHDYRPEAKLSDNPSSYFYLSVQIFSNPSLHITSSHFVPKRQIKAIRGSKEERSCTCTVHRRPFCIREIEPQKLTKGPEKPQQKTESDDAKRR